MHCIKRLPVNNDCDDFTNGKISTQDWITKCHDKKLSNAHEPELFPIGSSVGV